MAVRQIVGVVGAVVGYVVGGPQGAMYGWQIGSGIGNVFDPQVFKGPAVGELGAQTAQEGGPRPLIFGLSPPIAGNVIATSQPRIVKKKKSQGKGGSSVKYEVVYRTYAIGVCEGPIQRFVRIWRNGELVWSSQDAEDLNYGEQSGPVTPTDQFIWLFRLRNNALTFEERVDLFLGGYDQEASSVLEEVFGVGTTPSFRGTAYMVIKDDDVTDFRGAIPQYLFQVERCEGEYVTSRVYAVEDVESMHMTAALVKGLPNPQLEDETHMSAGLVEGTLRDILHFYTDWPVEQIHMSSALLSGTHRNILRAYTDWPFEEMHMTAALQSGSLAVKLITYSNWPYEEMHMTAGLQSGSLA